MNHDEQGDAGFHPGTRRRRSRGETPEMLARARELYSYNPDTGLFTLLVRRAARQPGYVTAPRGRAKGNGVVKYGMFHIDKVGVMLHRLAWAMHYGEWPQGLLDHEDHDPSNNRISNLRLATQSQNIANCRQPIGKAGARGVQIRRGKFHVRCRKQQKAQFVGSFATLDEAAHAYNKATYAEYGEFAILNPVGVDPRAA